MTFTDYIVSYFVLGSLAGLLSGLLGIGGGVVIVPGLHFIFYLNHFPHSTLMHMAIGTSFAVMVPTTLRSFFSHRKAMAVSQGIFKRMVFSVIFGVLMGSTLAHFLHSFWLRIMFSLLLMLVSFNLFFSSLVVVDHKVSQPVFRIVSFLIGFFSSMLGIGGSTFVIPFLLGIKTDMRVAIVVAVQVGILISALSCVSYIFIGFHAQGLPVHAIGYVYWPAALAAAGMSVLFAPLGAYFSRQVSRTTLRKLFACILMVIAVHSLYSILV